MSSAGFQAFAPATLSNLGSGFDLLGLAIEEWGDRVIASFGEEKGLHLRSVTGYREGVPTDQSNTAYQAALSLLNEITDGDFSVELKLKKGYHHSSGLGGSAASAVAAVVAVNALFKRPLKEKRDLLPFALFGERSVDPGLPLDNVSASLFGGIVLSSPDGKVKPLSLPIPPGLFVVVIRPDIEINTKKSRSILSDHVLLKGHTEQSRNLASLVLGLYRTDLDLIRQGFDDCLIEHQRAHAIPEYFALKEKCVALGALGFGISGSGPALFAVCANSGIAEEVETACLSHFTRQSLEASSIISQINQRGAYIV